MQKTNRMFVIFLLIHLIVWSTLPFIRDLLPVDAMESICWGGLFDFGTQKHPPLTGWLSYFAYNLLGHTDFSQYFLGQVLIVIGFIYLYKLGRFFLDEKQSVFAVMVLEGCFSYSYMTVFDGFSANFPLFTLFPAIAYYFYKSIKEDKLKDWLLFGLCVGLCFLAKYQTILLVGAMGIYALFFDRKIFKRAGLYLSILVAFLVFLPHLIWLVKNDFFSFMYFEASMQTGSDIHSIWKTHIKAPVDFVLGQIVAVIGSLVIFAILKFKFKGSMLKQINSDGWFLIILGLCPILLQALMGVFTGSKLRTTWGYPMVYMTGILLFYLFPIKTKEDFAKWVKVSVYSVMAIVFTVLFILFAVEKNFRSRYPYEQISNDLKAEFEAVTHKPLKYVGGFIDFALPISIYDSTHPQMILETYGHKNPWIDADSVKESGAIIISGHNNFTREYIQGFVPTLSEDFSFETVEYKFEIKNKFNSTREYELYYVIVPPMN